MGSVRVAVAANMKNRGWSLATRTCEMGEQPETSQVEDFDVVEITDICLLALG